MTVHDPELIAGSKGGGKGKGGSSSSKKNTLRSSAKARFIELISEGPIVGLVDDAKSIYFEETPVIGVDDTEIFKNVSWQQRLGEPDQAHFNGFPQVETPVDVSTQVKVSTGPVIRTVNEINADAVRVIVSIPALVKSNDEGKLKGTHLSYKIDVRPSGGDWTNAETVTLINQKTTSPTQRAHRIELPLDGNPWDIRVTRLTADSTSDKLQNDLFFDAYVILVEGKFIYPHSAMVAIEVDAEDMGASLPARSYKVRGRIVQVPVNYDPETREYSGVWNGTFKNAYTNNPAWVFNDIVTNDRYGLGEFVDPALIDKWSLYAIAQYCDGMVPTGFKDELGDPIYEPRYTFNGVINDRQEAFDVIESITRTWRGMAIWSRGGILPLADMPGDMVRIVSPANVIDGEFSYESSALKSRHSVCLVRWNDPNDFYRSAVEVVINDEMLEKYGWREKEVQLLGCTSRGAAHRYGKWILDTEQHETDIVTYKASLDHLDTLPGDIIGVSDPTRAMIRFAGRVAAVTTNSVTLDAPFKPLGGETYNIVVTLPDGSLQEREISSWAGAVTVESETHYTIANLATELSELPQIDAMWTLTGTSINPRQFRVLVVREEEPNIFTVSALYYDPDKYLRVEQNINLQPKTYTTPATFTPPPTTLVVAETNYLQNGQPRQTLLVSWQHAYDYLVKEYEVVVSGEEIGTRTVGVTASKAIEITDLDEGEYTISITAIGFSSIRSNALEGDYTIAGWSMSSEPVVVDLRNKDDAGSIFKTPDAMIAWDNYFSAATDVTADAATPSNIPSPFYDLNRVNVYNHATDELMRSEIVRGNEYLYTFDMNQADADLHGRPPVRTLRFEVSVTDTLGRQSDFETLVLTNSKPAQAIPVVDPKATEIYISPPALTERDLAGMKVWVTATDSVDVSTIAPFYNGPVSQILFQAAENTSYYIWLAIYDNFSDSDYLISDPVFCTTKLRELAEAGVVVTDLMDRLQQQVDQLSDEIIPEGFYASSAEHLNSYTHRITIQQTADNALARIIQEEIVRADENGALATTLTSVEAKADQGTASGLFSMSAQAAPSGFDGRLAMSVRADNGDMLKVAGLFLDVKLDANGGTSRVVLVGNQVVFADQFNNVFSLFTPDGAYINSARINELSANVITSGTIALDGIGVDMTVGGESFLETVGSDLIINADLIRVSQAQIDGGSLTVATKISGSSLLSSAALYDPTYDYIRLTALGTATLDPGDDYVILSIRNFLSSDTTANRIREIATQTYNDQTNFCIQTGFFPMSELANVNARIRARGRPDSSPQYYVVCDWIIEKTNLII